MIVKYQKPGEMLPRGYGVAYRRFDRDERVCYPIPLNILVWLAREVYFILAFPVRFSIVERRLTKMMERAYSQGIADGLLELHKAIHCPSCKQNAMQRKGP
jgi:hypothetical protein